MFSHILIQNKLMKYYILLLVFIGSILMVNQHATAQTTEQFQNRIVDSIFSKT